YGTQQTFTTNAIEIPVAVAASGIGSNAFTANWNAVAGATSYKLDVSTSPAFAPTTNLSDLIISEYVEGSSNNKVIELYNGTGTSVNLAAYSLKKQVNGAGAYAGELLLSGNLANGETYVIAHPSSVPAVIAVADETSSSQAINFNGNDAVALFKNGVQIDEVGFFNQSSNWGADVTLVRKPAVLSPSSTYNASEWTTFAQDTFSNLGAHSVNTTVTTLLPGYTNLTVNGTSQVVSGLTETTTYFYRVRAVSTNSTSGNSNIISVITKAEPATFGTITQVGVACSGGMAVFNVTGLLGGSTNEISYIINGEPDNTVVVLADVSGNASFEIPAYVSQNGLVLQVMSIERVDAASEVVSVGANNSVVLAIGELQNWYADADGDSYGDFNVAQSTCFQPAGYVLDMTDCNDADASVWQFGLFFVDQDADGYDNGEGLACYGETLPVGFSYTTSGADCDDTNAAIFQSFQFYTDVDNDSFGTGTLVDACAASATTAPTGYALNNTDCNDNNAAIFQSGQFFVDADADGYDNGSATVCYGTTVPAGYAATTLGSDCNDNNAAVHTQFEFFVDADLDGFGSTATALVCA
ncbi:MAG: hypothetical protein EOP49_28545, partial [Sphingobacteriales bacterium]